MNVHSYSIYWILHGLFTIIQGLIAVINHALRKWLINCGMRMFSSAVVLVPNECALLFY